MQTQKQAQLLFQLFGSLVAKASMVNSCSLILIAGIADKLFINKHHFLSFSNVKVEFSACIFYRNVDMYDQWDNEYPSPSIKLNKQISLTEVSEKKLTTLIQRVKKKKAKLLFDPVQ